MQKIIFVFIFFNSLFAYTQVRFFQFTEGWNSKKILERDNKYIILSTKAYYPYENFENYSYYDLNASYIESVDFKIDTALSTNSLYTNSYVNNNTYNYSVGWITTNNNETHNSFLLKFNNDYDTLGWCKIIPNTINKNFRVLSAKNDSILAIGSYNMTGSTLYSQLIEMDTSGQVRWQKDFGCGYNCEMRPFHILPTPDNGYLFTCFETHTNQIDIYDIFTAVIKTDSLGNTQWRHTWGGDSTSNIGSWVVPLDDGNYLYAWTDSRYTGQNYQAKYGNTIRFAKFDINGNVIWFKDLLPNVVDKFYEISQMSMMPDGNIIIAAYNAAYSGLLKIDQDANLIWHRSEMMPPGLSLSENTASYSSMKTYGVTCTSDGGFALAGEYFSSGDGNIYSDLFQSAYIYKLDEYGCYVPNCHVGAEELTEKAAGFTLIPNPAKDQVTLIIDDVLLSNESVQIFNLTGKMVFSSPLHFDKLSNLGARGIENINLSHLEQGIYLVKVGTETQRLIIN